MTQTDKNKAMTEEQRDEILKNVEEIESVTDISETEVEATPKEVKPKTKNITIAKASRQAKNINKMETYELNDEDRLRYYPIFPEKKIREMLDELSDIMLQASEKKIEMDDEQTMNHVLFLTIKHFTHLKKDLSDKFDEQLQQMSDLIDIGLFNTIVNDVFLPKQLNKVMDSIGQHLSTSQFIQRIETKATEKLSELEIKNREMMSTLSNKQANKTEEKYKKDLKH